MGASGRAGRLYAPALVGLALLLTGASSNDPADRLKDPAKEARARALFRETRCLVCQNQSIDESDAELAGDLRRIVRAKVAAGDSDAQIKDYLLSRYGAFVLERPRLSLRTSLLWGLPFAVLLAGGAGALLVRRRDELETPLSAAERRALAEADPELALRYSQGSAPLPPHESP